MALKKTRERRNIKGNEMHHLTGVSKPKRTIAEKIEAAEKILALFKTGTMNLDACCRKYNVSLATFYVWAAPATNLGELIINKIPLPKGAVPIIQDMYFESREIAHGNYKEVLKQTAYGQLLKKLKGEDYTETTKQYARDTNLYIVDEAGEQIPNPNFGKLIYVGAKVKHGTRPADTELIKLVLYNLDPDTFKNNKYIQATGSVSIEVKDVSRMTLQQIQEKKLEVMRSLQDKGVSIQDIEFVEIGANG